MTNLVNIKIWHDGLLSGRFPQGHGTLVQGGTYCCLGVASVMAIESGMPGLRMIDDDNNHGFRRIQADYLESDTLPREVRDWLGITASDPQLLTNGDGHVSASSLNDEYVMPFEDIAACIRRTWPDAFTEEES
jgi:hypothetical protein